jgi:16S rRNA (cytidine1402-2'-O)-methyltransferase
MNNQQELANHTSVSGVSATATTSAQPHVGESPTTNHLSSSDNAGGLFVISTPIGNPLDITQRAIHILKIADVVVAEEGKVAARLLFEHHIKKTLEELNEHNEHEQTPLLLEKLRSGKTLALVSDCGTPLLADPGGMLVQRALQEGIKVRAVPGVSSIMTALVTSGLPMGAFVFAGFVSREPTTRRNELQDLAKERRTVALLETPYRLLPLLATAAEVMPERRAYIGCNLTMPSETHHYGTFAELYAKFSEYKFKGEFVICFAGTEAETVAVPAKRSTALDSSPVKKRSKFDNRVEESIRPFKKRIHDIPKPSRTKRTRTEADEEEFANGNNNEQPFRKRASSDRTFSKPKFGEKSFEKQPFGKKPLKKKPFGERSSEDRPFKKRGFGERSSEDRPFKKREFGERSSEDRPFKKRGFGEKSFEKKPFGKKSFSKKPFGTRSSESKPVKQRNRNNRSED